VFINSSNKEKINATAKGMDGQNKLTAYTIPAHHATQTDYFSFLVYFVYDLHNK